MVWQGIIKAIKLLQRRACFKIGNSFEINSWLDLWILSFQDRIPRLQDGVSFFEVKWMVDLKVEDSNVWSIQKLHNHFNEDSVQAILLIIPWPNFDYQDKLLWRGNP